MSSPIAKFLVSVLGGVATLVGQAITLGLLSGDARLWASLAVGLCTVVATAVGVYFVPNSTSPSTTPAAGAADAAKPAA